MGWDGWLVGHRRWFTPVQTTTITWDDPSVCMHARIACKMAPHYDMYNFLGGWEKKNTA